MSIAIKQGPSPSDIVKSAAAINETVSGPSGPRYGRPSDHYGPPTALFSKPLAFLKYSLEHLESFTPHQEILNCAYRLVTGSTDFYPDEALREAFLKEVLSDLFTGENEWQEETSDKKASLGGVWLVSDFAYLIVQSKNEPGLGGDPFLQGLVAYGKIMTQEEVLFRISLI